jgi:hypothetical protein
MLKKIATHAGIAGIAFGLATALITTSILSFVFGLAHFAVPGLVMGVLGIGFFVIESAVATFVFGIFESLGMGLSKVFSLAQYRTGRGIAIGLIAAFVSSILALFYGTLFAFAHFAPLTLAYVVVVLWLFGFFVVSFIANIFADVFGAWLPMVRAGGAGY